MANAQNQESNKPQKKSRVTLHDLKASKDAHVIGGGAGGKSRPKLRDLKASKDARVTGDSGK
jgi:hypothetical protein